MKRKFKVLYTHQKTKKKKTWQDGYLTLTIDEKRGFLTDEEKRNISTVYLNKKNVECGSALESDKYLIQVDDEIMSDSPQLSQQEKVVMVTKPPETPVTYSQNSQTVVKKSRGFSVPRKVVTHIPVPEVASAKFQPISAPVKVPEKCIWNEVLPLTEETTNLVNEGVNIGSNLRGTQDVLKMLGCTGPVNSVLKEVSSNVDPHVSDHSTQDSGLSDFFEELSDFSSLKPATEIGAKTCLLLRPKTQQISKPVKQSFKAESKQVISELQERMRRELFFPTHDDLSRNPDIPEPSTEVPTTFASVDDYRNIWRTVVKEHFNFKIWAACKQYHSSMRNADLSKSLVQSGVVYSYAQRQPVYPKEFMLQNVRTATDMCDEDLLMLGDPPYCDHNTPCRMNRVKKEGPNIGRIFYSCARKRKCKFFKWAEVSKIKSKPSVSLLPSSDMVKINNERALASYLLQNDVKFFTGCALRRKSVENNEDTNLKETLAAKYLYLQLSREDRSLMNIGLKDSLWAVSTTMDFTEDKTELFQAILNKTTNSNEIVVQPVNSTSSRLLNEDKVVVMYVCKSALEFSYLRILQDDMNLPMVTSLLNMKSINKHGGLNFTGTFDLTKPTNVVPSSRGKQVFHIEISYDDMISLSTCYVKNYNLNEQQSKALLSLVDMLKEKKNLSQIFLLDGVVGSGKTFLLSVIIMYLIEVMSAGDGKSNKVKILVTGKSNSVVDCLFHQLRALGCERMVRIGNLENINRNLLPYSLHSLGGAQEHAKKLQKMLQSSKQSQPSNYHIQKSLELVRSGSTKRMLHKALVVGMTCDEINSPCVRSYKFPIVIMDNATETSELSTLLPLVEFGCEKLLLAGDSRCLTNHNSAFTQSLFSRIHFSIEEPIILTDHYRCHNQVIDLINNAFYNDVIIKALSKDRPRLVTGLPNFCLYDVTGKEEEKENDFINSHEATFVADIIRFLLSHGVPGTSIVVIATTKAQVKEVEMTLQEIEFYDLSDVNCIVVTTIDDYDGWETNVAIVTCVRTSGTNDMHDKIIPLLTRGRHHNLVVGNLRNLSTNEKWSSVIGLCKEKRIVQNSFQFKKMSSTRSLPFAPEVPFNAETIDDVIMKRETKNQSDASDSEDEVPLFCHKRKRHRIDDVIIDDDEEMFAVDDVTKTDNDIIPFGDDITKTSDHITKTTGDITTTDDITTSDNITKTTDVITTSDNISTTDDITKTAGDITKTSDHITTTDTVTTDEIIPTSNDNITINTSPANDITTNDIISTR